MKEKLIIAVFYHHELAVSLLFSLPLNCFTRSGSLEFETNLTKNQVMFTVQT